MLSGIRIVEFEGLGPAPFAGMLLADLGAEVIVVHRPKPAAPSVLDRGKR
ncbi:MAG: CoA transferase, partial [Pseudomonadota bacterium]